MPTILTITDAELLTLCRLPLTGDLVALVDVQAVKAYQQEAEEDRIQPLFLSAVALAAVLRRGVALRLAGEIVEMRGRDGSGNAFTGFGVTTGKPAADFAGRLRDDAALILLPYLNAAVVESEAAAKAALWGAQAAKVGADAVIARFRAGLMTLAEARTALGVAGEVPVPVTSLYNGSESAESAVSAAGQAKVFGKSEFDRVRALPSVIDEERF